MIKMVIKDKLDFYRELGKKNDITMDEAEQFWNTVLEVIDETLSSEDETYCHLPDLGKMMVYPLPSRNYKNPYTLEYATTDPKRTVKLHVFPAFKKKHKNFTDK